jgi:hypothetical protein
MASPTVTGVHHIVIAFLSPTMLASPLPAFMPEECPGRGRHRMPGDRHRDKIGLSRYPQHTLRQVGIRDTVLSFSIIATLPVVQLR